MPIEFHEEVDGNVVTAKASGKLTKADYEAFLPKLETLIQRYGKICFLFETHDFHGWELGAAWEDLKFGVKHYTDIERIAIVGETRWQELMIKFCSPFTAAKIKYFTHDQADQAGAWVRSKTAD
jgi:hypothetical protein